MGWWKVEPNARGIAGATAVAAVAVLGALLLPGCSGKPGDDTTDAWVEVFEMRSSSPNFCADSEPPHLDLYRSPDGSLAWVDDGRDGIVDGVLLDGVVYLPRDSSDGPAPVEWISFPADSKLAAFAALTHPDTSVGALSGDPQEHPMDTAQNLKDQGMESPAPFDWGDLEEGPPAEETVTVAWSDNDSGEIMDMTITSPADSTGPEEKIQVSLSTPAKRLDAEALVADAQALSEAPAFDYLLNSATIDPRCGQLTAAELGAARPCFDEIAADKTVGEWVDERPQDWLYLPVECSFS